MDAGLLYKANITFKDNNPMKWVEEAVYLGANITRAQEKNFYDNAYSQKVGYLLE